MCNKYYIVGYESPSIIRKIINHFIVAPVLAHQYIETELKIKKIRERQAVMEDNLALRTYKILAEMNL